MKSIKQINLARVPNRSSEKVRRVGKILSIISFLLLVLFLILYTVSFSLISYLSVKYDSTQERVNQLSNQISEKKGVEAIKLASFNKLRTIDEIMKSQLPYKLILKDIFEFIPPWVQVKSVDVDTNGTVNMETTASSSAALDDFVTLLMAKDESENIYKNINASSISRDTGDSYNLNISFALNKEKFHED